MTIKLPSGFRIVVSPFLPWDRSGAELRIRSGGSFPPSHVTTRLCLRLLDQHREKFLGARSLDVGCGTGILALTAARMGAEATVGVDISRPSVELARRNAIDNRLEARSHWVQGSAQCVAGRFTHVMANLPFNILASLLEELLDRVDFRGYVLLSGFHDIELSRVEYPLKREGFSVLGSLSGDLSFPDEPPDGSYTWMALLAAKD
jgi:ribosomal protein L11 methylase PrmA